MNQTVNTNNIIKKRKSALIVLLFSFAILLMSAAFVAMAVFTLSDINARRAASLQVDSFLDSAPSLPAWENETSYKLLDEDIVIKTEEDAKLVDSITVNNGLTIKSYSSEWKKDKLYKLYDELLKNKHGDEIGYLSEIIVYPSEDQENVVGQQEEYNGSVEMYLRQSAFPDDFSISFSAKVSTIHLYNGDERTTIESMAKTLSHEYGHLFTNYYIFKNLTVSQIMESDYAKIRGLNSIDKVEFEIKNNQDYMDNHKWYIYEIAAEDYVAILGSPTAKRQLDFKDVSERLYNEVTTGAKDTTLLEADNAFNSSPQENMSIQLAKKVPDLTEYLYGLIEEIPPSNQGIDEQPISITLDKKEKEYYLESGWTTYVSYKINFDRPYTQDGVTYTLVAYDENDNFIMPVKTVDKDDDSGATIGNVAILKNNYVYSLDDELASGTKIFRIIVMFPDGQVYATQPYKYTF